MSEYMRPSHVFLDAPASTVDEAFQFFADEAVALGIADDAQAVADAFNAREGEGTTGMMEGFSIPHAKCDAIKRAAVLVIRFREDIEWESMDDTPVRVAIALLVPGAEKGTTHLKLLSQVAVLLMDEEFRGVALASESAEEISRAVSAGLEA